MKINSYNSNLNLRHLRALHAIALEGSFSRAAELLGVVPSALTETVRQLEEMVGASLFDRRIRPPQPTEIAYSLIAQTQPFLDGLDNAFESIRESVDLERGRLRLGASPSAISKFVAPALARFRRLYPKIAITLHDDIAERLASLVAEGHLDLAIAGSSGTSAELDQTEIDCDHFGIACRKDHPLARLRRSILLEEIDPGSLIHLDANTGTARLLAGEPSLKSFSPGRLTNSLHAHSTVGQLCLIRAGAGIGLLPRNAVMLFDDPAISFVEIADLNLLRRLFLLKPARRPVSHTAEKFILLLNDITNPNA
jgi:DNA-binding transcriptional LysR family regulator